MSTKNRVYFSEAHLPIEFAVKRMIEKPEAQKAFVIIEQEDLEVFVQFAVRDGVPLFDVPMFKKFCIPCKVEQAAELAITDLQCLGVAESDMLTITEDDTFPPKKRLGGWLAGLRSAFGGA